MSFYPHCSEVKEKIDCKQKISSLISFLTFFTNFFLNSLFGLLPALFGSFIIIPPLFSFFHTFFIIFFLSVLII